MYAELAATLFSRLEDGTCFYNGKIEYDTEEFYSTLVCSLIVYRSDAIPVDRTVASVEKVMPVWWNYTTCAGGVSTPNDFSWSEFIQFFPGHA
jgi:hypothetical protein